MKSPYRVPLMSEIEKVPWNGYNVVSTFSGCGGSCLGFRMEGFRVPYAVELVQAAQETYRANDPSTFVDGRNIRTVTIEDIRKVIGDGELDVLEGSPPCNTFSAAGDRDKSWGQVQSYSDVKERTDDLFFEYLRLLEGLRPRMFVAENVEGLARGRAKGLFIEIMTKMKALGYRAKCKLLDAQWMGVPQARKRTIFIGVREDLGLDPAFPEPLPYRYSVRDACPNIVAIQKGGRPIDGWRKEVVWVSSDITPSPTIVASGLPANDNIKLVRCDDGTERKYTVDELRRICGFPDDFILTGSTAQQKERLGRAVPPVMMAAIAREVKKVLDEVGRR
jgi:DNA (cytosine-5)-methyltransferase 1